LEPDQVLEKVYDDVIVMSDEGAGTGTAGEKGTGRTTPVEMTTVNALTR